MLCSLGDLRHVLGAAMIYLQLQRKVGPLWVAQGEPCEAGSCKADAEALGLHWLAEVYGGSTIYSPGVYRIQCLGECDYEGIVNATVDQTHPEFEIYYRDEVWRQREREKSSRLEFLRD